MTFLEAKQEISRKLNVDLVDIANNGLFANTDLEAWINLGAKRAWDYKLWDFSEGDKKLTSLSAAYYDYPQDFLSGSIDFITVGGKEFKKINFRDYLRYKENYSTGTDKVWAERKRYIFINQNAYAVGDEIDEFGKLNFTKLSADADLLPFSPDTDDQEYSGNQAVVLFAYAEALDSEKKKNPNQARIEEKKAFEILDLLWKPFAEQQANAQRKDAPMFDVPDFFGGGINRGFTPGNFNS